ncbi:MAG: signal peptidase II [Nakamurella sp.]
MTNLTAVLGTSATMAAPGMEDCRSLRGFMIVKTQNETDSAGEINLPSSRSTDIDGAAHSGSHKARIVSTSGASRAPTWIDRHSSRIAQTLWPVAVVVSVVMADAASKSWVRHDAGPHRSAFGGVLQIRQVRNAGAAFGLGSHYPGIILAAAVISTFAVAWWLTKAKSTGERLWISVVLGGALGNLVDRLTNGAVTDWLHVAWYSPTFNLADIAIRIGVLLTIACRVRATCRTRAAPATSAYALGNPSKPTPGSASKQSS